MLEGRSPRSLLGMEVLGGERLAQDLLHVNEMNCLFVNSNSNIVFFPPFESQIL